MNNNKLFKVYNINTNLQNTLQPILISNSYKYKHKPIIIMKKLLLFGLLLCSIGLQAQIIEFEDLLFKQKMVAVYDLNGDNEVDKTEALNIKFINVSGMQIRSLKGIENFPNLEILDCSRNMLFSIDVSKNTKLKKLKCVWAYLQKLDLTNNPMLTELQCAGNIIKTLNLSNNKELKSLRCGTNELKSLDTSNNKKLETIWCDKNQLTTLDVSQNTQLKDLNFEKNLLTSLNIKNNTSHSTRGLETYNNPELINICADFHEVESIKVKSHNNPNLYISTCIEDNECETIIDEFTNSFCPLFTKENIIENLSHIETDWYTDITFSTALDKNHPLEQDKIYYSKKLFGCNTLIKKVTVVFYTPQNLNTQPINASYCIKDKKSIIDLMDTPENWLSNHIYSSKNGGVPLHKSILLEDNMTYYKGYDQSQHIASGFGECWIMERTPIHVTLQECSNLSTPDYEFDDQLSLFPNPVTNKLNIQPKNGTQIQSFTIYNIHGQIIMNPSNQNTTIDVSNLAKGIYIITVTTDQGILTKRFIK